MSAPLEDADIETASAGYAARFDSPVGRWMLDTQVRITLDLLKDLRQASILDVGGGHGQIAPALAHAGRDVTILASSPGAVASMAASLINAGQVKLKTGDLRMPQVEPLSFDVALSYRLIAHARDLSGLVSGLCRAARVAVIVDYATTRSFNAASELLFSAKKGIEGNTRPFLVMKDSDLVALFAKNGFARRARRPQFLWPMALHRALNAPLLSRSLEGVASGLGLRALFGSPVIARFDRV